MSNIVTATVKIKGLRPLMWHRFGPDALPLEKQERTGVAGNDPEEWRRTVLVDNRGQLFVDPSYIFGCLREGGRFTKKGRGNLVAAISATLQVLDDRILVDRWFPGFPSEQSFDLNTAAAPPVDSTQPVYLDIRGVRNPTTRARNVRYRVACTAEWQSSFTIYFDKTVVSRPELHAVAIDAGTLIGVGDARGIGFGRFSVEAFEEA